MRKARAFKGNAKKFKGNAKPFEGKRNVPRTSPMPKNKGPNSAVPRAKAKPSRSNAKSRLKAKIANRKERRK